ncbi:MAG: hypothetical protein GY851_34690, partial [bacterium]|nr:hypothetical protein [bacterium]
RIPAYLVLERNWPRVKPYTELAFQDVLGFYDNALLPDGGYLEGPTYLNMTLHYALLSTDLYARGRGLELKDLAPPVLLKTADYIMCVSSTLPERDVIPIEDCGVKMGKSEMLAMSSLAPDSYWVTMCRKALARDGFQPDEPNEYTLLRDLPETGPEHPAFVRLPETRMVASLRDLDGEPVKWLIIGNKGDAPHSHEHEDRGSFVLEFAGDRFGADLGAESYNDANHILAKQCQLHNMLVPTGVDVRPKPTSPILSDVDPVGDGDETAFHIEMDATPGWDTFYKRWVRTWDSPDP